MKWAGGWILVLLLGLWQEAFALECEPLIFKGTTENSVESFFPREAAKQVYCNDTMKSPTFGSLQIVELTCRCPDVQAPEIMKIEGLVFFDFSCKEPHRLLDTRASFTNFNEVQPKCKYLLEEQVEKAMLNEVKKKPIYLALASGPGPVFASKEEEIEDSSSSTLGLGNGFQTKCEPTDLRPEFCWSQLNVQDLQGCRFLGKSLEASAGRSNPRNPSSPMLTVPLKPGLDFNHSYPSGFKSAGSSIQDRVQDGSAAIGTTIVRTVKASEGVPRELTARERTLIQKRLLHAASLKCFGPGKEAKDYWGNPYPVSFYYADESGKWVGGLIPLSCSGGERERQYFFGPIDYPSYLKKQKQSETSLRSLEAHCEGQVKPAGKASSNPAGAIR